MHKKKAHMKEHEKKEMSCKHGKEAKGMKKEHEKKEHHHKKK